MKQRTSQSSLRRTKLNSGILEKVHFDEDILSFAEVPIRRKSGRKENELGRKENKRKGTSAIATPNPSHEPGLASNLLLLLRCSCAHIFSSKKVEGEYDIRVINHWVGYFYVFDSLMLLFERFCKSRSFN